MQSENISLLRMKQVIGLTGLPRSSVYALIAKGDFPKPIALTTKAVAWPSNAVDSWIAGRIAASNNVSCNQAVA